MFQRWERGSQNLYAGGRTDMLPNAPSDLPWRVLGTAKRVKVWNLRMLPITVSTVMMIIELAAHWLGGVGGAFPIKKTSGVTAVEMIPRTRIYTKYGWRPTLSAWKKHTDCLVLSIRGLINCPMAPPIGLAVQLSADHMNWYQASIYSQIAMIIVAVVRPLRLNHTSEYLGPSTW